MKASTLLVSVLCAGTLGVVSASAQPNVTYQVRFESTWSADTHPTNFPPNPHFSGLIGATHGEGDDLWQVGELASAGIQSMAETGAKTLLRQEIALLTTLGTVLDGGGINRSPGAQTLTFEIDESASRVSLVSMLAPSPDWFVGVSSLDLRDGDGWQAVVRVDLYAYDAGTDDGVTYQSANQASNPHLAIERLETDPFLVAGRVDPVGSFAFTLVPPLAGESSVPAEPFGLSIYPNPSAGSFSIGLRGARAPSTSVMLVDVLGRQLHQTTIESGPNAGTISIPIEQGLSAGTYYVLVQNGADKVARPITVRGHR